MLMQTTLRRMVYLCIKLMADIADDVIIVTSSLTKDMTGKVCVVAFFAILTFLECIVQLARCCTECPLLLQYYVVYFHCYCSESRS